MLAEVMQTRNASSYLEFVLIIVKMNHYPLQDGRNIKYIPSLIEVVV